MRFDILTLFPALCETVLSESVIGRARASGAIDVRCYNIRDYSEDKHHRVDDTPYGGGRGMLMAAPPVFACYEAVLADRSGEEENPKRRVVYLSPKGRAFDQSVARELAAYDELILLCGHYEGIDQRIIDGIVDEEISVGDFVLTGGEIPACLVTDAVARLVPGVLSAEECYEVESFSDGLLEFPQYTRPYEFRGEKVPDVLLSGNHAEIDRWRRERSRELTARLRPDLIEKLPRGEEDSPKKKIGRKQHGDRSEGERKE
ncbi:MAG: tRNA (guanosine(37)-N1)-methyltransferase TrmD [Clostridia bacterium]|nr:tRNA (guanosine(37)-N1)-methyltransferase TrmD [Clostridia bacterium]